MRRLACLAFVIAAACGPKVKVDDSPFEVDDPAAGASSDEPRPPTYDELPQAPAGPGAREGTIDRASLNAVLDAGPGPILAAFEVAAELENDRFVGWRLVAVDPDRRLFDGVDLVPGDVLVALNGVALVKPSDLDTVWTDLRTADAVVADIRRGATRFQLRWAITAP